MKAELISKSEYARRRGCKPSAVTRAIKEGRIIEIEGKIDPMVADMQWTANTRARSDSSPASSPAANGSPAPGAVAKPDEYHDHRSRREKAEADIAEMNAKKMAGALLDRDAVRAGIHDAFRMLRDRVMAVPKACAAQIAVCNDPRQAERIMAEALRGALAWQDQAQEAISKRLGASVE